ncbi:uncharacterized protein M421DRAFT_1436 [Didymella exigua CBS 183.55]|uniref:Uncharacterized protein n=1 Tax=Didymella exigua CBS 183.55 TaxID=1150837 RepID=A0A6A5RYZ4_9PLEO|nr:uncharacterized protein M421DRAFT_1436 [Didymella exigua CBS 183.55]KAF1932853.1 hypothetical protein M421DRAFT_1436 [Didymella exigua CBS 183.55]
MTAPSLPIDIWLIIFEYIDAAYDVLDDTDADSLTVLWCFIRNVAPHLRDCIDEYFCHGVLQNMLVNLSYSNINRHGGPAFAHLHPKPRVVHRGVAAARTGPPAWEKEHLNLRGTLSEGDRMDYLAALRDHTGIGSGYRPPLYLKLREAANDTELVDLVVDIEARELSFDWRRTPACSLLNSAS